MLTLAPEGEERSGNPWHVREYRAEEYRALCERHFGSVELLGLFHARKLRAHQVAIERLGWDSIHAAARHHQAVLRPLHAGDLRARLRAALRRPRPRARLPRGPAAVSGRLSIVLHTHMPYVEGFGTWPFGEEWLWEAMATSYLPLLDVLDAHPGRVTLSLTPVLCDQLEAPGVPERFLAFLREIRPETHRRDIAAAEDPALARELERSAALYAAAADRFEARGGDLVRRVRARTSSWTSSATHAVLPLLATAAGVRLQVGVGIAAHRERFGHWDGGFWLPECGHAPWLDPLLEEAGVHAACVDLTDVLGYGDAEQLRPLRTDAGPLLVPIDRALMDLVWHTSGYPSAGAVPQYAPPHRVPPHAVGGRRRALRPGARGRPGARARARLRGGGGAAARGRRAGGRARSTPSCSGTSGTRASTGSPR